MITSSKKMTKKTYVMSTAYNEEFGLLAVALIDHEVKIYYLKQHGV